MFQHLIGNFPYSSNTSSSSMTTPHGRVDPKLYERIFRPRDVYVGMECLRGLLIWEVGILEEGVVDEVGAAVGCFVVVGEVVGGCVFVDAVVCT